MSKFVAHYSTRLTTDFIVEAQTTEEAKRIAEQKAMDIDVSDMECADCDIDIWGANTDDLMSDPIIASFKRNLFDAGVDAIEDFIGEELTFATDNELSHKIDDTILQMPDDELNKFIEKYTPHKTTKTFDNVKTFDTDDEAKEYGKNFGLYHWERVLIANEPVMLCGSDKAYEEALWSNIHFIITDMIAHVSDDAELAETIIDENDDVITDTTSEIRETVLDTIKKITGIRFLHIHDEY